MRDAKWLLGGTATALAFTLTSPALRGSVLVSEEYSDTASTALAGQTGGTGFGAAWADSTSAGTISSSGLTYSDGTNSLTVAGNAVAISSVAGTGTANALTNATPPSGAPQRAISATTITGTAGSTIWISFLIDPTNLTSNFDVDLLRNGTNSTFMFGRFAGVSGFSGSAASGSTYGIETLFGGALDTGVSITNASTLVVIEAVQGSSQTAYTVYVDPTLGATAPASPTLSFLGAASNRFNGFQNVALDASANANFTFDEFRVGQAWTDVTPFTASAVPEPASLSLLGIAATGLLRRRRK